jgi:hypothetical protein
MRHLKGLAIGISVLALLGCAAQQKAASGKAVPEAEETASMEGMPTLVNQISEAFYVYEHDGRYYVIGSAEMARKFARSGPLPYTRTLIGAGPHGRTVVFEVVKKKPEYVERLQEEYESTPHLVARDGDDYFVYHQHGRYYVIGSTAMSIKFIGSGHLPYTHTLVGGGPQGKTVVFEVDKKKPEYVERLMARFQAASLQIAPAPSRLGREKGGNRPIQSVHGPHGNSEGRFDVPHRLRDLASDQVHFADLLNARGGTLHLPPGEQGSEDVAYIGKRNDDDVAHVRYFVAEQDLHDPQLHFPDGLVVDDRVAPRLKHPQEMVVLLAQDAPLDETREGALTNFHCLRARLLDPIAGVVLFRRFHDARERRIQQIIVKRCRIGNEEPALIGIDPALDGQIHQHRAGKRVLERQHGNVSELPPLVVQQKQQHFLRESQHARSLLL